MAQEKYAYGSKSGDMFADDDPLAELARIVGYDQSSTRARPAGQRVEAAPAPVRVEPAFNLEDELLKEFERYDAPNLDPVAAIPVDMPVAEPLSARAEVATPRLSPRVEPPLTERFEESGEFTSPSVRGVSEPAARSPLDEIFAIEPKADDDELSFEADLADELELAVAAANVDDFGVVVEAGERGSVLSPVEVEPSVVRREPSFDAAAVEDAPVLQAQAEPAYDVRHYNSPKIEFAAFDAAPEMLVPEPVLVEPARQVPELQTPDVVAEDEFDLALDGLEIDLADIVLNEVETVAPVAASVVTVSPKVEEPAWSEPPRAFPDADFDGEMPFDASQIADPDYAPEVLAEMDVPAMPVHETDEPKAHQPAFDTDFDAELADLIHDDRVIAAAVAKPSAAATQPAQAAVDLDDFSLMMNQDFREDVDNPLGMERSTNRVVIDPDSMEVIEPEGSSRARRWILAAAASVGVVALVGGGYAWMKSGGATGLAGNGGPPIVLADSEPVKVVPENPGGKTVPNQDKAVYDRVAGGAPQSPTQKSLISSSEEPLDVVQRTLTPENFPLERAEDEEIADGADQRLQPEAGSEAPADKAADANVSLRKVRTMIVRPDGTLVAREVPETTAPVQPAQQTAAKLPASSTHAAPAAADTPALRTEVPATQAPAASSEALSQAAAATTTADARTTARSTQTNGDRAPVPTQRPVEQPVNVVGTVTGAGNVRPATQAPTQTQQVASATPVVTTTSAPSGAYVVQIASLPSQAEAEKSAKSMSGKYGSVIGGRGFDIKAADIPGKGTFYRVRVVASSKDEANALCTKLKAAGGSCLVTR